MAALTRPRLPCLAPLVLAALLLLVLAAFAEGAHTVAARRVHGSGPRAWFRSDSDARRRPSVDGVGGRAPADARRAAPVDRGVAPAARDARGRKLPRRTSRPPLLALLCADALAAAASSALLSPIVTIMDKSVTLSAAGQMSLGAAIRRNARALVAKPRAFLTSPEYVWIFGLYAATYAAANTISTYCERTGRPSATPKLAGTTLVNIYACVSKDAAFAQMFGAGPARSLPRRSLALFSARDAGTVFASFLLPARLAAALEAAGAAPAAALNAAQLACPVAFQALSAPVHLLGLDLYNRGPGDLAGRTRLAASVDNYFPVVGARMARVLPAFGIGGIGNRMLRGEMLRLIEGRAE